MNISVDRLLIDIETDMERLFLLNDQISAN